MLGDQVVEHGGSKVLLVEEGLAASLEGLTIDVEDVPNDPRLVVKESQGPTRVTTAISLPRTIFYVEFN